MDNIIKALQDAINTLTRYNMKPQFVRYLILEPAIIVFIRIIGLLKEGSITAIVNFLLSQLWGKEDSTSKTLGEIGTLSHLLLSNIYVACAAPPSQTNPNDDELIIILELLNRCLEQVIHAIEILTDVKFSFAKAAIIKKLQSINTYLYILLLGRKHSFITKEFDKFYTAWPGLFGACDPFKTHTSGILTLGEFSDVLKSIKIKPVLYFLTFHPDYSDLTNDQGQLNYRFGLHSTLATMKEFRIQLDTLKALPELINPIKQEVEACIKALDIEYQKKIAKLAEMNAWLGSNISHLSLLSQTLRDGEKKYCQSTFQAVHLCVSTNLRALQHQLAYAITIPEVLRELEYVSKADTVWSLNKGNDQHLIEHVTFQFFLSETQKVKEMLLHLFQVVTDKKHPIIEVFNLFFTKNFQGNAFERESHIRAQIEGLYIPPHEKEVSVSISVPSPTC